MKLTLFFLFSLIAVMSYSQTCSNHALFKKGAQLSYNVYIPQLNIDGSMSSQDLKFYRLIYDVENVVDSAGQTYSTITKRGISERKEKDQYKRKIVLQCDGKNLLLPYDFYTSDTIFFKDVYKVLGKTPRHYLTNIPMEEAVTYVVPLAMDGVNKLPEGKTQVEVKAKRNYYSPLNGVLLKEDINSTITIKNIKVVGRETVETPAGSFECYKLYVDSEQEFKRGSRANRGRAFELKYWLFFNKDVGLVKLDGPGGTIELIGIDR